jgi:O-antigen chain-terminating methyltransferase
MLNLPPVHALPEIRDLPAADGASEFGGVHQSTTAVRLTQSIEQIHGDLSVLRTALRPLIEDFQLRANFLTEQLYRHRAEATEQWEAVKETRWDLMNLAEDLTTTTAGADKLRGEVARASGEFVTLQAGVDRLRGEAAEAIAHMREAAIALDARATAADRGIAAANEHFGEITRSSQANAEAIGRLEERLNNEAVYLKAQLSRLTALLDSIKRPATKGAERGAKGEAPAAIADADIDAFYLAFENAFRGKRGEIKSRMAVYLPFLEEAAVPKPDGAILDLGCGRGEWLELLKENKFRNGAGVDLNSSMVEQCTGRGLDVVRADAIEHLRSHKDDTLEAVTSFHLIEHLAFRELIAFLHEIHRVLKPGGVVILETPNPRNILVGASDFFRDLTHNHPIHPDTIRFTLETLGFAEARCYFLGDGENGRTAIPDKDFAFPDLQSYVEVPRDYAAIARKA